MESQSQDNQPKEEASSKKYTTAVMLSGIFGVIGIHHFYVERWGMGIFDLGLFLIFAVYWLQQDYLIAIPLLIIDVVHTVIVTYLLLVGKYRDGSGKLITYPGQKI
ncbi:MAG: hypothetical protein CMP59_08595 [Flavobacteriales bacterium]|nr:hypothetical protein [Flavobacteriales bacterium]|tara:strand:+ start:1086 stop:1403 length:318 start_codon:yes stop_codon:yes gene_type:complete